MQQKLTQQQIKQRRRQRILARAAAQQNRGSVQSTQSQQNNTQNNIENNDKKQENATKKQQQGQALSPFQVFKATQFYDKMKGQLCWASVGLGVVSAAVHLFTNLGSLVFVICLLFIISLTLSLQVSRSHKIKQLSQQNSNDKLLSQLQNIKSLQIVSKVMNFQTAISPLTKLFASYFLFTVIFNCVYDLGADGTAKVFMIDKLQQEITM